MSDAAKKRTFIYGAGNMGREVLAHCRAEGIEPVAFIDRRAATLRMVDSLPVIDIDVFEADRTNEARTVLLALHNPGVDVDELVRRFDVRADDDVRTLWMECRETGWLPAMPYWLEPRFDFSSSEESIRRARALLADDASRDVFDRQLALRRDGAYGQLGMPTPHDQYVPVGLPRWREPMHLVDCGAYDGDTVRLLRQHDYTIERLIALEPDPSNFERLDRDLGRNPALRRIKAGAASFDGHLAFDAGMGTSARADAQGSATITVVPIDTLCADFRPTLIKMDIEGAEQDALDGAAMTIVRDRPDLAISVYHRVYDLWSLMLGIHARVPSYDFYLRSHARNGFETVLYGYATA